MNGVKINYNVARNLIAESSASLSHHSGIKELVLLREIRMQARYFIFILAVCALASLVAYGVWLITSSNRVTAHANLATRNASKTEEMLLRAAQPKPLLCPVSHGAILPASPETGHHKVILTWNASAPSINPKSRAVGYCLYRIASRDVTKRDEKCSTCEQINKLPIAGTVCVDDWVQDGATYDYVATAINEEGHPSSLSNDTLAKIPATAQVNGPAAASPYPRCRADNGSH